MYGQGTREDKGICFKIKLYGELFIHFSSDNFAQVLWYPLKICRGTACLQSSWTTIKREKQVYKSFLASCGENIILNACMRIYGTIEKVIYNQSLGK